MFVAVVVDVLESVVALTAVFVVLQKED